MLFRSRCSVRAPRASAVSVSKSRIGGNTNKVNLCFRAANFLQRHGLRTIWEQRGDSERPIYRAKPNRRNASGEWTRGRSRNFTGVGCGFRRRSRRELLFRIRSEQYGGTNVCFGPALPTDRMLLRPLQILAAAGLESGKTARAREAVRRMQSIRINGPDDSALVHGIAGTLLQIEGQKSEAEVEYLAAFRAWEEAGRSDSAEHSRNSL